MQIIVEDGTGVIDATSYVSVLELDTYATDRGLVAPTQPEEVLARSMDFIETQFFIGMKKEADQALQWPRLMAFVDGYPVTGIPKALKMAQLSTAMAILEGYDPLAVMERKTSSETVDIISVSYEKDSAERDYAVDLLKWLDKIIVDGAGSYHIRGWKS